jgi:hypothetical protein
VVEAVSRARADVATFAVLATLVLAGACRSLPEPAAAPQMPAPPPATAPAAPAAAAPAAAATPSPTPSPSPSPSPSSAEPTPPPSREPDGTVHSTLSYWRCTAPSCRGEPWPGAVIDWPSWAAYQGNGRRGNNGRDVFSAGGRALYPYMGAWADGCVVKALSGFVQVVEWKRGSDKWRSTRLKPGDTYVIKLVPPEDGAMLEAPGGTPTFSVALESCTPKPLP